MQMGGLFGGLYRITEWITRLAVTNLLWFLSSSPFIVLIALSLISTEASMALFVLLIALLIAPVTFFPATTAMFSMARKWANGDEDAPLFKGFVRGYKENYKQSLIGGLIYSLILGIVVFNIRFYSETDMQVSGILMIVFIIIFVLVFITMFNFFSFLVHVRLETRKLFRNAVLITLGKPGTTLFLILSTFAVGFATYQFPGVIFFFSGSVIALISFIFFKRNYIALFGEEPVVDEFKELS